MVSRVHVVLEDDLDGGEATQTVSFEFDGTRYEMDLNDNNAAKLREAFAPWTASARKVTKSRARVARKASSDANEIRTWARNQGIKVSDRGRVSAEVREAYARAH